MTSRGWEPSSVELVPSQGWMGPGGPDGLATYVLQSIDDIPALPEVRLDGTFAWLPDPGEDHEWAIGASNGSPQFDVASVGRLEALAVASGVTMPAVLLSFLRSERRNWIRSVTGCWLDLPTTLVKLPGTEALAIRFLNDQQGVCFWHVAASPAGQELGVVVSDDLFDSSEPWLEGRPAATYLCAPSFEAFMLRTWLESEIWFRTEDNEPLSDLQREYAERARPAR